MLYFFLVYLEVGKELIDNPEGIFVCCFVRCFFVVVRFFNLFVCGVFCLFLWGREGVCTSFPSPTESLAQGHLASVHYAELWRR